jgi:hypothetical protein
VNLSWARLPLRGNRSSTGFAAASYARWRRENFQSDSSQACFGHPQYSGRGQRDVDAPPSDKGSAIIDANYDGTSIGEVRHADHCAEGQRGVCGRLLIHVEQLAARRRFAVVFGSVVGGNSCLPLDRWGADGFCGVVG